MTELPEGTLIQEKYVNETKGYRIGESEPYEPYTLDIGDLFLDMQREYGRCIGKVYVGDYTIKDGAGDQYVPSRAVGWVFQSRQQYTDTGRHGRPAEFYIREVWVTFCRFVEPARPALYDAVSIGGDHFSG